MWVDIRGHPGYTVSEDGKIMGPTGIIQSPYLDKDGYPVVKLGKERRTVRVARAVAIAFIPNPDNLPQVNHKNGNKLDHSISNLEWVTDKANTQHSYDTGLHKVRPVVRHNGDGTITTYRTSTEAAKCNGIASGKSINSAIHSHTRCNGYYWSRQ